MKLAVSIVISMFFAMGVFAQKESVTAELLFPSILPMVHRLPLPDYPKIAKEAGLGGRVSVAVILDEKGNVVSADDADGPYPICQSVTELKVTALRDAALAAAKHAHFQPIEGLNTDRMSVRIVFTFVAGRPLNIISLTSGARIDDGNAKSGEMRLDRMTKLGTGDGSSGGGVATSAKPTDGTDGTAPPVPMIKLGTRDGSSGTEVATNAKPTDGTDGTASSVPKTLRGGVLNGKATTLAKPPYPAAARAVHAGGQVNVQVTIFEDGSVYSASAVSGHPLLRRSSEIAACSSKFTPTLLSGQPVKVTGVITYNYVP